MTDNQHDFPAMLTSETINEGVNIVGFKTDIELREGLRFNPKRRCQRLRGLHSTLKVASKDCVDARIL